MMIWMMNDDDDDDFDAEFNDDDDEEEDWVSEVCRLRSKTKQACSMSAPTFASQAFDNIHHGLKTSRVAMILIFIMK